MKRQLLVSVFISLILFSICVPQLSEAFMIYPGVYYPVKNGNYSMSSPLVFSQRISSANWIKFNDSGFNLTSAKTINVSLVYLDDDIISAPVGTTVLSFYANSSANAITRCFNVSGFKPSYSYSLFKDSGFDSNIVSSALGTVNFSHVFNMATHLFELRNGSTVIPVGGGGSGVYLVTIRVVDGVTKNHIAKATVTLEGVSIKTTDGFGEVVFSFLLGTYYSYILRVSAKGYVDFSQVVRFNASQTLTVNLSPVSNQNHGIPGFEFIFMMAGAAVCMMVLKRKMVVKKK